MSVAKIKKAIKSNSIELLRASLFEHPEHLKARLCFFDSARSPFVYAVTQNRAEIVKLLAAEYGIDIHQLIGRHKRTALHYAAKRGNSSVIEALLKMGADPCVKDKHGKTPLDVCSKDSTSQTMLVNAVLAQQTNTQQTQAATASVTPAANTAIADDSSKGSTVDKLQQSGGGSAFKKRPKN